MNTSSLRAAALAWISVATLGQVLMAAYVTLFYGGHALRGQPEQWNRVNPHFYTAGDTLGNAAMGTHVALTVLVLLAGGLQLLPALRRAAPGMHRWLGRIYLLSLVAMVLSGLYMVWVRGGVGDLSQHLGVSFNGLCILVFAALAYREARARRFDAHRRWALRVYVAALGVFFYRLSMAAWLGAWRAPVGFDPHTFTGPLLTTLSWGQTLVPLLLLEVYLRAQAGGVSTQRRVAAGFAVLTLLTVFGVAMATLVFWLRPFK